jgi:hypothetical protein
MTAPIALFEMSARSREIDYGIPYGVRTRGISLRISAQRMVSSMYWRAETIKASFRAEAG